MTKQQAIKLYFVLFGIVAFIAVIAVGIYEFTRPPQGTRLYGSCRVFAELYIRFPETIHIEKVEQGATFVEITLNHLNAHGSRPTQVFRCDFAQQGEQVVVSEIRIDREKIDQAQLDRFNLVFPYLLESEGLNMNLPPRVDDNNFETYKQ